MGTLDRLATAETSSDLQHHDRPCDVDVLAAAGMAASHNHAHMSLFRLKYLNDATELDIAKRLFVMWARRAMINRKLDPAKASRLGVQALTQWISDICQSCNGLKYPVIVGTPTLSDKPCQCCKGTGRSKVKEHGDMGEVVKDLHERADTAIRVIQGGVKEKMGDE